MFPLISNDLFMSVDDARSRARRILPRVVFDYIDGGADDELTMAANIAAFQKISFEPRMASGAGEPAVGTEVLGKKLSLPVILAPCGLVRLMHPDGAPGVARAAAAKGTVSVLSTVAGNSMEEVSRLAPGPKWFQMYAAGGRPEASELMARASQLGYEVLVITVDTPALGNRERDLRNGVRPPLRLDARSAVALGPQVLFRPRWAWRMMRDGVSMMSRARPHQSGASSLEFSGAQSGTRQRKGGLAAAGAVAMLASPYTWDDVEWIRGQWDGGLVVKGILGGADAKLAGDAGADAVVVSNHGGRQLDSAPATARVLPQVVDTVGDRVEVLVDGGVRRGGDVIKALALGARAVMIGRPYLYALAVGGEAGVRHLLDLLETEISRTMRLLGCGSVAELDRSWLHD